MVSDSQPGYAAGASVSRAILHTRGLEFSGSCTQPDCGTAPSSVSLSEHEGLDQPLSKALPASQVPDSQSHSQAQEAGLSPSSCDPEATLPLLDLVA